MSFAEQLAARAAITRTHRECQQQQQQTPTQSLSFAEQLRQKVEETPRKRNGTTFLTNSSSSIPSTGKKITRTVDRCNSRAGSDCHSSNSAGSDASFTGSSLFADQLRQRATSANVPADIADDGVDTSQQCGGVKFETHEKDTDGSSPSITPRHLVRSFEQEKNLNEACDSYSSKDHSRDAPASTPQRNALSHCSDDLEKKYDNSSNCVQLDHSTQQQHQWISIPSQSTPTTVHHWNINLPTASSANQLQLSSNCANESKMMLEEDTMVASLNGVTLDQQTNVCTIMSQSSLPLSSPLPPPRQDSIEGLTLKKHFLEEQQQQQQYSLSHLQKNGDNSTTSEIFGAWAQIQILQNRLREAELRANRERQRADRAESVICAEKAHSVVIPGQMSPSSDGDLFLMESLKESSSVHQYTTGKVHQTDTCVNDIAPLKLAIDRQLSPEGDSGKALKSFSSGENSCISVTHTMSSCDSTSTSNNSNSELLQWKKRALEAEAELSKEKDRISVIVSSTPLATLWKGIHSVLGVNDKSITDCHYLPSAATMAPVDSDLIKLKNAEINVLRSQIHRLELRVQQESQLYKGIHQSYPYHDQKSCCENESGITLSSMTGLTMSLLDRNVVVDCEEEEGNNASPSSWGLCCIRMTKKRYGRSVRQYRLT